MIAMALLADCSGLGQRSVQISPPENLNGAGRVSGAPLSQLVSLDRTTGTITVFSIQDGEAKVVKRFLRANGRVAGIAMDRQGLIYTTVTSANSKPCSACVEAFNLSGQLMSRLPAPVLSGAPGAPSLTGVSVDRHENVYVSDYGQQAIYFFPKGGELGSVNVVVQGATNATSVLATPNGSNVLVSDCGFEAARPYRRAASGEYKSRGCFGVGTPLLIGGAVDDRMDVLTPVDGATGLVSVSSPFGGIVFHTPDERYASITSVTLNANASIAYVADDHDENVYAFERPALGWLVGHPPLLATYRGFENLDIIAVRP